MHKKIWLNLLNSYKKTGDATHPHVILLEDFLAAQSSLYENNKIEFNTFLNFSLQKNVTKKQLFAGPAAKLFRTLTNPHPELTRVYAVENHTVIYRATDASFNIIKKIKIDLESYYFVEDIGKGNNGHAALYENIYGQHIVLKRANSTIPHDGYMISRERDIQTAKTLYPNDGLYCFNENIMNVIHEGKPTTAYNYFAITPFIPGKDLKKFCANLKTETQLLQAFLAVIKELQRAHANDIIHGDFKAENILLWFNEENEICVRLIDFEWSYKLSSPYALTSPHKAGHWGSERLWKPDSLPIIPHSAHDTFSFGYALKVIKWTHPLAYDLEIINKLIEQCMQEDIEKRPRLSDIETQLDSYLETLKKAKTTATSSILHSSSSTAKLIQLNIAARHLATEDVLTDIDIDIDLNSPKENTTLPKFAYEFSHEAKRAENASQSLKWKSIPLCAIM